MGVVGVQLVASLVMASLMQRLAPHYSIGRWLICNGSLFRFRHPTDDELRALSGKQKPKVKRDRRQNGVTEQKPETVPRDINLQLDAKPITAVDALVLRYFLEYQWLVDFVLYATLVYVFTEVYYCLVSAEAEVNVGVLWCLLTLVFAVKMLVTLMSHYFGTEDGGERSVCLTFAFLFLVVAMLILVISEDHLEFGLEPGFAVFYENVSNFMREQGIEIWPFSICRLVFKLSLVAICSFTGAFLTFPSLRLAQTQLDALKLTADRPAIQFLLHISFMSPVLVLLLWVKPLARDFVLSAPFGKEKLQLMTDSGFNTARLWAIVAICAMRLAVIRYHLQAYLNLADKWADQLKREVGNIAMIDIQRKVTRVFCYLCVVTLQYLGPIILLLHCTLLLKVLGDYSWGVYPETPGISVVPAVLTAVPSDDPSGEEEEDYQVTVSHITASLGALRNVPTPLFYRGLFSFLAWWLAACQTVVSLFGLYFHQSLMAS